METQVYHRLGSIRFSTNNAANALGPDPARDLLLNIFRES